MVTEILHTDNEVDAREAVNRAVATLQAGDVVALPTETVYGLGADALDPAAVEKIFEAKERPHFDPLIVHLPHKNAYLEIAEVPSEVKHTIVQLVETFWPGPLTILLPKKGIVPDIVTAGLPTIGVRMSEHPVFKRIARSFGRPIAAPSANRFGCLSPTSAEAVLDQLEGKIPLVINGGACSRGLESTIVKVLPPEKGPKPIIEIIRPGPITEEDLKKFGKVVFAERNAAVEDNAPEAPGQLLSHYAPRTRLRLLDNPSDFSPEEGKKYGLLSYRGQEKDGYINLHDWDEIRVLSPGSGRVAEAGIRFFSSIRELDDLFLDEIISEPMPDRGVGKAMLEKLRKASYES
ncbi:MAG: L-threonylcarbamoyladenylate synthase [Verrucomicrobiales bacterium]|nr:L-threonylcarbamoyladenylate synthase [Verrucomicrobiales bacterium]